jgi:hypothetical protein
MGTATIYITQQENGIKSQSKENYQRGEDTVQICIYCQGPLPHNMRWLWFTLKDGGAWFRAKAPNISRALAESWEEKLIAIIEAGDGMGYCLWGECMLTVFIWCSQGNR